MDIRRALFAISGPSVCFFFTPALGFPSEYARTFKHFPNMFVGSILSQLQKVGTSCVTQMLCLARELKDSTGLGLGCALSYTFPFFSFLRARDHIEVFSKIFSIS